MKYSIQYNDKDIVLIRVFAPVAFASAFLAFIEQKSRENVPVVKSASSSIDEGYLMKLKATAFELFDGFVEEGFSIKEATSKTNYALKSIGYANVSYDITKQILSKSGRLSRKNS